MSARLKRFLAFGTAASRDLESAKRGEYVFANSSEAIRLSRSFSFLNTEQLMCRRCNPQNVPYEVQRLEIQSEKPAVIIGPTVLTKWCIRLDTAGYLLVYGQQPRWTDDLTLLAVPTTRPDAGKMNLMRTVPSIESEVFCGCSKVGTRHTYI
jgi:hypothetical protein